MTGTLINVAAIVIGALLGIVLKKGIPARISEALLKAEGLAILIIGLGSVFAEMFKADPATGLVSSSGGLVLLVSLVLGCLAGEVLRIDDHLNNLGHFFEARFKMEGFAKGFVNASLVFCVGTMSIMGPITEALSGDATILHIKSILDGTTSIVLASTMGAGVLFSAAPVLLIQGSVALLAGQLAGHITPPLLSLFCMVGYALVTAIGINFLQESKIKVANLLPAMLVPIVYFFLFR